MLFEVGLTRCSDRNEPRLFWESLRLLEVNGRSLCEVPPLLKVTGLLGLLFGRVGKRVAREHLC